MLRIEPPESWLLSELMPARELPDMVRNDRRHRYVLVRFDCSFRPRRGRVTVDWARFAVELLPDATGEAARAEDMHPWRIEQAVRRHVSLKISPSLKFQEVEGSLGELVRDADYDVLEPLIEANGRGGPMLSWDYSSAREQEVSGGKRMHALMKLPDTATKLEAVLGLSADLRVDRRFLWPASRVADEAPMRVRVWAASPGADLHEGAPEEGV